MLPTLTTQRLLLRARTMDDLDDCFRLDREPGTLDFIDWPGQDGAWDDDIAHRGFIRARIRGPYPPGMGYWIVTTREAPGTFLGWVLLIPEDATGPEVEIGWRFLNETRRQGTASEAAAALLKHADDTLGLSRVVADIYPQNTASCRVAEKIGMIAEGPTPEAPHLTRYVWAKADG